MARAGSAPLFMKLVLGVLLSYFLLYRLVNRENWTYLSFQLPVRGPTSLGRQEFQLRHIYRDPSQRLLPDLERHDVSPDAALYATAQDGNPELLPRLFTNSKYVSIQRLIDRRPSVVEQIVEMSRLAKNIVSISSEAWTIDTVHGPNATDRETILAFARMSLNAYTLEPNTGDWDNKTANFTNPNPFGWEDNGLRGHVFASTNNNSTVVIAFKGTSLSLYDDNSTTSARDKTNDNLLFSCCCGQGGHFLWKQVCQCKTDVFTCSSSCLEDELTRPQYYYKLGLSIYASVLELYPNATVWVTGHSLGGSIAGLLASTYGLPAIAFEAPADAMPASRLKLPVPPSGFHDGIYHFGHTADPVYMGICNRLMSTCSLFGYAFESVCHQGW